MNGALFFADVEAARQPDASAINPRDITFVDGLDALLVTEAVARSSQEQRWIAVQR